MSIRTVKKISVIGVGFVGLTMSVCFASRGFSVYAVEQDTRKVEAINRGLPPFYEPMLEELLNRAIKNGTFACTTNYKDSIINSDITFITVGTPPRENGDIDLSFLINAAEEIGNILKYKKEYHLIVVRSTVIPGTTEGVIKPIIEEKSNLKVGLDVGLCMNPEFLSEGSAILNILNPSRIVIGEYDKRSGDMLENFYRSFYGEECPPILRVNIPTAEMIKYASNIFLAARVSLINEIANICEKVKGVDVVKVAEGVGLDPRIGSLYLKAGLGFGGSCLPKDLKALINFSRSLGYEPEMLKATLNVNERQPFRILDVAKEAVGDLKGKRVAVLGLAFKPETSDVREAPSIKIIKHLLDEGADVVVYDPKAIEEVKHIFNNKIVYAKSALECIRGADCCLIVTEWEEFKSLKPEDFLREMKKPVVIDGRRIFNPKIFAEKLSFKAIGLGR